MLKRFFKSKWYYKKRITSLDDDGSDLDNKDSILKDGTSSNNEGDGDGNGMVMEKKMAMEKGMAME